MPYFSPKSFWNQKASNFKVHLNSEKMVAEVVKGLSVASPTININSYSFPVYKVSNSIPIVTVRLVKPYKTGATTFVDVEPWDKPETRKLLAKGVQVTSTMKPAQGDDAHLIVMNTVSKKVVGL